jgi:DNA processing protein
MPLRHWLQLALTDGIGPILARRLIDITGGAESACVANSQLLQRVEGVGTAKSGNIADALRTAASLVDAELDRAASVGATLICPDDEIYPLLLRNIPDPPLVLYVKGTIEPRDLNAVGIVGSRKCSHYGREQADRFGALLAGAGVTVISGGARGIDSAAHRGAMSHPDGRTLAVLGCGVNIVYPPENAALFDSIAQRGAIISEYPIDTPPVPENFPKRNRIVSGMSRGVLVIEADIRSGALITARLAGDDQGRPVFALPGRVDNQMSAGPHQLIRDGATLVTNLEEILEALDPLPHQAMQASETPTEAPHVHGGLRSDGAADASSLFSLLSETQRLILSHLDGQAVSIDRLIDLTDLDAAVVTRELTFLCLKGLVKRGDGQTYARGK